MRYKDLEKIIDEEMKTNNACDVYKLTTEHLKFSGRETRLVILNLLNNIISNITILECPQSKAGVGTAAYI